MTMMRCFLLINNINRIDLYVAGIEVNPQSSLVLYLSLSNILKSVLCMKKIVVDQQIILSKNMIN